MSLNQLDANASVPDGDEEEDYVDPILFTEGIYADQQEYRLTIDAFADRMNEGAAVPRGREIKKDTKPDIIDSTLFTKAVGELTPFLRTIFTLYHVQRLSYKQIAKQLNITPGAARVGILKAATQVTKAITGGNRINITEGAPVNIKVTNDKTDDPLKLMYLFIASQTKKSSSDS
jgi:hypothetical protein